MRISREQMYMGVARVVSMRSTCCRLNVGAVIVSPANTILGVGYNGSPPGAVHCGGHGCRWYTPQGCKVIHAEINAISRAPYMRGSSLFVTHSPCMDCAKRIVEDGMIQTLYYESEYRLTEPLALMESAAIPVFRLLPSGYLLHRASGQLREV